jgi:DNA polymerase I
MPKLVLIDGHSLAFRAFHALPPDMSAPTGELTNAVYGFMSMLLKVLQEQKPEYVAVAFDLGRPFRHDLYEAYKGHRERTPDELHTQVERIKEIVHALNIPIFELEPFEADDILATLALQAESAEVDTLIVTGDRDILQVVDDHITVLTSGRFFSDTIYYTPESVKAKYGLEPTQLLDLKALIGDKSDNIPGVKGVGEKGATDLLQRYGTLEAAFADIDNVTPNRLQTALKAGQADAELSRKLGKIVTDVPLQLDLEACRTRRYDRQKVVALFQELAFRSLANALPPSDGAGAAGEVAPAAPTAAAAGPAEGGEQMALFEQATLPAGVSAAGAAQLPAQAGAGPILVLTAPALIEVAEQLASAPRIAFDTETTGTDPYAAELVGVAVAWGSTLDQAAYIPLGHCDTACLPWETVRAALSRAFENPDIEKIAHNASYDIGILDRYELQVAGQLIDTMIAAWLIDPGLRGLGLKDLVWTRLKTEMTRITDLIGTGKAQITMDQVPAATAGAYAGADAAMTMRLAEVLLPEVHEKGLDNLLRNVEMPLVPVLVDIERTGVKVDVAFLKQMSTELTARVRKLEREIQEIAGIAFNVNSTQQLSDILFGKLGLPTDGLKKTQSGSYSTAADVLEGLRGRHEIIDLILEQRQLTKLLGTYVDALPTLVNARTGRVHTSFNQTGAETGRLSSSNPNLQNIPIRSDIGREIRKAFIAEPGNLLLSADYSQVELRILAHITQDQYMLAAFARGEDIHASAAAKVYGVAINQVSKEQRAVAKMMNFATSYGVTAFGLAQRTGLSRTEAGDFMNRYFATYPGVKKYIEETTALARRQGYVETLLGRRRYFPVLKTTATSAQAYNMRQAAERAAINHPIQGTAADIIKMAMVTLHRRLKEESFRARMILQVHDELVLETPEGELARVAAIVKDTMEGAFQLDAPLKVDMESGPNWFDQNPVE